ncbi:hypothetical protein BJX76DRAFT_328787 [Aspergillus varians]
MATILLVGAFLFADEKIPLALSLKRFLYFTTIISSVIASVLYPPSSSVFLTYANAFLSVAFVLRAVELLVINHPSQLKRLQKVHEGATSSSVYIWQRMPPALGLARLLYVCDLLLNPRGIGWAHGSSKYLPPLDVLRPNSTVENGNGHHSKQKEYLENTKFILKDPTERRLRFLAKEARKLIIAYIVFRAYKTFFEHNYLQLCIDFHSLLNSVKLHHFALQYLGLQIRTSPETSARLVRRLLLPPACWAACYAFVDGMRAAVALFAVGGLYLVSPTLAGDPWMYPAIFGSSQYLFSFRLKDIWGKLWHDLCRRALVSSSTALVPLRAPFPLRRVLVGFVSFVISGVVHAAGTYAVSRDTHAVLMMVVFFILLPICIAAQEGAHVLVQCLPDLSIIKALIWILDATYVISWGYHTAPWFFRYSMIPESLAAIPVPDRWSVW